MLWQRFFNDAKFTLQNQELCYSENVIHLGLPIGSREFVNNHLKEKFKKVERSFTHCMDWAANQMD
jgi:hypothetical protein